VAEHLFASKSHGVIVVILFSLQQGLPSSSLAASVFAPVPDMAPETDPLEFTAADMSLSTLYLHELHHQQVSGKS
jgi:autophagy-related protein 9